MLNKSAHIELSIVIPTCNEEGNILPMYERLTTVMNVIHVTNFEFIFVDDGSSDRSLLNIQELRAKDSRVKFIQLSRNFGHQNALKAGLDHAQGAAVISMDADLQHPPELIPTLFEKWKAGFEVVYTIRKDDQKVSFLKKWTSKGFYRLTNKLAEIPMEEGTADFRLLDRKVVAALQKYTESHLFLRGIIPSLGFKQIGIPYTPHARVSGQTKYSFSKMLNFALTGITSSSAKPLYFSIYTGLFFALLAFLYGLYAIYVAAFTNEAITGWTSIIASILFIGGIQLIMIGILGIYLGKLFIQSKNRPLYLITEKELDE
jgi:glycosyltransferase involved in cell wall biosynthesis